MEQYFYQLNTQFKSAQNVMDYLQRPDLPWITNELYTLTDVVQAVGVGLARVEIPLELIEDDLIHSVIKKFDAKQFVMRLPGNHCYRWHTDLKVRARLNVNLTLGDAHTFFGTKHVNNRDFDDVAELRYEKDRIYTFNTSQHHCVFNLTPGDRLVYTVGLLEPYSHEDLLAYCKSIDN